MELSADNYRNYSVLTEADFRSASQLLALGVILLAQLAEVEAQRLIVARQLLDLRATRRERALQVLLRHLIDIVIVIKTSSHIH